MKRNYYDRHRKKAAINMSNILFGIGTICFLLVIICAFQTEIMGAVTPQITFVSTTQSNQFGLFRFMENAVMVNASYLRENKNEELASENTERLYEIIEDEVTFDETAKESDIAPDYGWNCDGLADDDSMIQEFHNVATNDNDVPEVVSTPFDPSKIVYLNYDLDILSDFNTLVKKYYTIDRGTEIDGSLLNAKNMLAYDARIAGDNSLPQILILHTHASEDFMDSIPGDSNTTIVGMGELLANTLRNEYGFNVIHYTGVHDQNRDKSYQNIDPKLQEILAENPSIEVVIDLHRDGIDPHTHLIKEINGKPTAPFMFFNGLCHIKGKEEPPLDNPYVAENLATAFQMQLVADEMYEGITRNIYLKAFRYNMQYRPKSILIEVGAQTNTVQEVANSMEPIGRIVGTVLSGKYEK